MKKRHVYGIGVMIIGFSACVSPKKYQLLTNRYENLSQRLVADTIRFSQKSSEWMSTKDSLSVSYSQLENRYLQLKNDSSLLAQNYRRNKSLLDDLFEKYDRLDQSYKQLSGAGSADAITMAQKEKDLLVMEQKLLAQQSKNDKLSAELQEREIKLLAFENSIRKMDKSASDFKLRLEKSVATPKDSTLTIERRAGKVILAFPEPFAFPGTTEILSAQSIEVLKKAAPIFKSQSGLIFTITLVLPQASASTWPAETPSIRRLYEIVKYASKNGVTFARIVVMPTPSDTTPSTGRAQAVSATVTRIEITAEPKLEVILQGLQNN